ncbi:TetR/AcrR family transcriptional regulator [Ruania alkalisoli]|uniref:TetR/AcrR family transcriptional regulator n=1 Tax=Ruania alkalisoli TaxID=2779775 RepID=A0A7M1SXH4_9MICO|nr:TetR/AcrR family transcriptional regulator [Ruania alkalisoli]QOR72259.1 TetR/AcrR family transcriptional regulator [Ruania alkalisoli]
MSPTPRERARAQTERDIIRIARTHLATGGAASLSLRAVARDLGVVSSAVYRYVRSRDDLLTLLVVEGYNELGDAVDAALTSAATEGERTRFYALGNALRSWATSEPAMYALLYGTPVPGYDAPGERTTDPGTRVILALADLVERAYRTGRLTPVPSGPAPAPTADYEVLRRELALTGDDVTIGRTFLVWHALIGAITAELFGQYGPETFSDPDALFAQQLSLLADTLGLPEAATPA